MKWMCANRDNKKTTASTFPVTEWSLLKNMNGWNGEMIGRLRSSPNVSSWPVTAFGCPCRKTDVGDTS